jgi:CubicO group peptidase (beta-lactamase class C family)
MKTIGYLIKRFALILPFTVILNPFIAEAQSIGQKLDSLITAYVNIKEFNGSVLVARQGKILLQRGYGIKNREQNSLNNANTLYSIASITKTFTSTIVLKLIEQGKLSVHDKLNKYFPGYPHGDSITVENLLTHTSGIYDYIQDNGFMFTAGSKPATPEKILSLFKNKPLNFEPGKGWEYSNSNYVLLGFIIEQLTGVPYSQAVKNYIFKPLGMKNSGFDFAHNTSADRSTGYYSNYGKEYVKKAPMMDSSVTLAAGSIYSTIGDLYKWHKALQTYQIINKTSANKAYTPFKHNYGYGWIVDSLYGKRIVSHSGGFWGYRSNFARVTGDDICIVLLSNYEIPGLDNITKTILAVLYNKPYKLPAKKKSVKVNESILSTYTGTYEISVQKLLIDVKLEKGNLVTYPVNGPKSELSATDNSHFFVNEQEEFEISFEKDEKGTVTGLTIHINNTTRVGKKIK